MYQYRSIYFQNLAEVEKVDSQMNEFAQSGWEYFSNIPVGIGATLVFRRQNPEDIS